MLRILCNWSYYYQYTFSLLLPNVSDLFHSLCFSVLSRAPHASIVWLENLVHLWEEVVCSDNSKAWLTLIGLVLMTWQPLFQCICHSPNQNFNIANYTNYWFNFYKLCVSIECGIGDINAFFRIHLQISRGAVVVKDITKRLFIVFNPLPLQFTLTLPHPVGPCVFKYPWLSENVCFKNHKFWHIKILTAHF
jgi:hypothetical protein